MTTDTEQIPDALAPIDAQTALFQTDEYEDAAAQPKQTEPGRYAVQFPKKIATQLKDNFGTIVLEAELGEMRLVTDEYGQKVDKGFINKFYSCTTARRRNEKWSDLEDILRLFGVKAEVGWTKAEMDVALASAVAGKRTDELETPYLVHIGYTGRYKHPLTQKTTYLKSEDFFDGTRYSAVFVSKENGSRTFDLPEPSAPDAKFKEVKASAEAQGFLVVFPNLSPDAFRPFEPRKKK